MKYLFILIIFVAFYANTIGEINLSNPQYFNKMESSIPIIDDNYDYYKPYLIDSIRKLEERIFANISYDDNIIRVISFNKTTVNRYGVVVPYNQSNINKRPYTVTWIILKNENCMLWAQYRPFNGIPNDTAIVFNYCELADISLTSVLKTTYKTNYKYLTDCQLMDELTLISIKYNSAYQSFWVQGFVSMGNLFMVNNPKDKDSGFVSKEYIDEIYSESNVNFDIYNKDLTKLSNLYQYYDWVYYPSFFKNANLYFDQLKRDW